MSPARRRCRASNATSRSSSAICLQTARDLGAKVLATGHYVASRALPGGGRALYRAPRSGARPELFPVRHHAASSSNCLRFPLGDRTKAETRELARRFGLPVADKQDSQDICFVPSGHYADVIERLRPGAAAPGEIVDLDGRVLGRHDGIIHFTVGQRRGLGIADRRAALCRPAGRPIAPRRGRSARGAAHQPHPAARRELAWRRHDRGSVGAIAPKSTSRCARRGRRSRLGCAPPLTATIEVELVAGEDGVSPGQACAFYDAAEGQARVLGGGIIASTVAAPTAKRAATRQSSRGALIAPARRGCDGRTRWRANSTRTRSPRPMRAGRRSTTWYSARCSSAAARLRSPRPNASAAASSRSASAPACRCRIMRWTNRLTGVDLSAPMLRKAKARAAEHRLTNVEALAVMDAQRLGFQDGVFDVVVAQYVITAVPDPEATLDEFARVLKPGGEIILVNHLGAEAGLRAVVRAMVRAAGAPAGLAAGIPLGTLGAMGCAARRRARGRAPADAAARAFFADPFRPAEPRPERTFCSGRRSGMIPKVAAGFR